MGAVKSFTHTFTWGEYLFAYIERRDIPHIVEVLDKKPELINSSLTVNYITTPLHRAAYNGDMQLVTMLVEKYEADVNKQTAGGETALMAAVKRNQIDVVRYLLNAKADPDKLSKSGLTAVDYAILAGLYEMALQLDAKPSKREYRHADEYADLGLKYKYRYVNYPAFLDSLKQKLEVGATPNFLKRQKKLLQDPVIDPRETWKQWFLRTLEFKDPPLVERRDLPQELQPQNRRFGKVRHYLHKTMISPISQKPSYLPQNQTERELKPIDTHEQGSEMEVRSAS